MRAKIGISFLGAVTLVLLTLKIAGIISISWFIVLLPLLIDLILDLVCIILFLFFT